MFSLIITPTLARNRLLGLTFVSNPIVRRVSVLKRTPKPARTTLYTRVSRGTPSEKYFCRFGRRRAVTLKCGYYCAVMVCQGED